MGKNAKRKKKRAKQHADEIDELPKDEKQKEVTPKQAKRSPIQTRSKSAVKDQLKVDVNDRRNRRDESGSEDENGEDHDEDDIGPGDSVSQMGSHHSRSSSYVRAMAESAALAAEETLLSERHEIARQELELHLKREALELKFKRAKAEAQLDAMSVAGSCGSSRSVREVCREPSKTGSPKNGPKEPKKTKEPKDVKLVERETRFDPDAPEFVPREETAPERRLEDTDSLGLGTVLRQQQKMFDMMQLPAVEMTEFDGDPLKYYVFTKQFLNSVDHQTIPDSHKLTRLLKYCVGKARKVIECCAVMEPSEGYERALKLLKERFGDKYKLAEAWVGKVANGPPIGPREKEKLQDFADDLNNCVQSLSASGLLSEVNTQNVLVRIVQRLPSFVRTRWLREVQNIKRRYDRFPNVNDLSSFVCDVATECNDPVYSTVVNGGGKDDQQRRNNPKRNVTTLNTTVKNDRSSHHGKDSSEKTAEKGERQWRPCWVCRESHSIFSCADFKKKSVDDRRKFAAEKKLCFNCLNRGHTAEECRIERVCDIDNCGRKHSRFLHPINKPGTNEGEQTQVQCNATGAGTEVMLPIIPIWIRSAAHKEWIVTHALLDNASSATFCTENLRKKLDVKGRKCIVTVTTMHGSANKETTILDNLEVSNIGGTTEMSMSEVHAVPNLPISPEHMATRKDIRGYPHLKGISLPSGKPSEIGLLIGQDNSEMLVPLETKRGKLGEPYAVRTPLGWVLHGLVDPDGKKSKRDITVNFTDFSLDLQLERKLERFWKVEGEEFLHDPGVGPSLNDKKVIDVYESTIQKNGIGHYELEIPFKSCPLKLPNNKALAEDRLRGLKKKLTKNENLRKEYTKVINKLLENGHAEPKKEETDAEVNGETWFIPHQAVINPKRPGKVRVVFDCSAKYQGTSLNDKVFGGPDLTSNLLGVLLRFREREIAFMGDIEAMFNQVFVPAHQRNVLCFLWWPDGDLDQTPKTYRMTTHLFGGSWSPSACNFALRRIATDQQSQIGPEVRDTILKNFYVDDCLKSVDSEEQGVAILSELREVVGTGGFKLTKFVSNSGKIMESVPPDLQAQSNMPVTLISDDNLPERALGLLWKVDTDALAVDITIREQVQTRRQLLSYVASIYDPLGVLGPFVVPIKVMMQDLTKKGITWDEPLPPAEQETFLQWINVLQTIRNLSIPRCIQSHGGTTTRTNQLHIFADASERTYGAVAYLRQEDPNTGVHTSLMMSKSRLAPIKAMSIPRLELSAAVVAVRISQTIASESTLDIGETIFWTDSTIVLQYIQNENKRFQTFVANRLAVIQGVTTIDQWRHVPSKENPADDLSRGLSEPCKRWMEGPEFLKEMEDKWPQRQTFEPMRSDDPEVKRLDTKAYMTTAIENENIVDKLANRSSSWFGTKLSISWFLRAKNWLRDKAKGIKKPMDTTPITVSELRKAESSAIQYLQERAFENEIQALRNEESLPKDSKIIRLCPIIGQDGLLRLGGRLSNSALCYDQKHPIILPQCRAAELIIMSIHEMTGHVGREHLLSLVRSKYWILGARRIVRKVLGRCAKCRRHWAKPMEQRMAELPSDRVNPTTCPFSHVGVDCFGPILVKQGRSQLKRYGCLFTCLNTRAVHIELLTSMDTDSFINGLRRFVSRRGKPELIRSDRGTNFVGAQRELKEAYMELDQERITRYLRKDDTQWLFNTPTASHHGGVWERMIRSIKTVLSFITKEQVLTDEALHTLMCEAESIVNSRPITTVSDDPKDAEPLTPNHLLLMRESPKEPPGKFVIQDRYRKRWRQIQYLADVFWKRWLKEYLPALQERSKWYHQARNLKPGDVVLLVTDSNRGQWPLARVVDVYTSADGIVRSVKVLSNGSTLDRPISKVCLLEAVE